MLAGLLFLGVIAASAMPDLMGVLRGSADDDIDGETEGDETADGSEDQGSMLDDAAADDDPAGGADLFADPVPGTTLVEAFNPGVDTLTVAIPDSAQDFSFTTDDEAQSSTFGFTTNDGVVEIRFDGLADIPVDDIFLRVSDASSPTQDADIALMSIMEGVASPGDVSGDVLQPEDPEAAEDPADPLDQDAPVLAPEDPEQDEGPADPAPFTGPVLRPVLDDVAPEPTGNEHDAEAEPALGPTDETDETSVAVSDGPAMADQAAPRIALSPVLDDIAPESDAADQVLAPDLDLAELPSATLASSESADVAPLTPEADDPFTPPAHVPEAEEIAVLVTDPTAEPTDSVADTNVHWLYRSDSGRDFAEVDGFTPGEDLLQISLDPLAARGAEGLDVIRSDDGHDSLVKIGGVTVAVLKGMPDVGPDDIVVEMRPEIFA